MKSLMNAILAMGLVSLIVPAQAADLAPPFVEYQAIQATSGWYLRGDIAYSKTQDSKGEWDFWNQFVGVQGIDDTYRYDSLKLRDTVSVGVGIGYQVNEHVRTDATLDFFHAKVAGKTECPLMIKSDAAHALPFPADCHYDDSSTANVMTAMANAYVDLKTEGRFRPYLGAGVGGAYVKYGTKSRQEVCALCPAGYTRYTSDYEGVGSVRAAAALMVGTTYDLTDRLKLDAGYRFMHIFGGDAYKYDAPDRAAGATGAQVRDNGFNIHQIRAGLRYALN
ncbi:outer membrane beta-barrel protein [Hoeflea sp. IMCC20628]|uniref:outer membrane protein n=1 Tax=Hoeflea sp. IMCC20628 TaxID=1620421 RepID=UPI00063AEFA8|nr:outer membrane beta-barrel protein [Hoeflea sp. IMCC20628]